jgi:hypothetical protein
MEDKPTLDQIREDVEERQKAILWEDARKGGRSVDAFLWRGDPKAKPIQRAGLIVFGFMFLLPAVFCFAGLIVTHTAETSALVPVLVLGTGALLVSLRLFRNAFLRSKEPDGEQREDT